MTIESLEQIWKSYQGAWADIEIVEREHLLRRSVAKDVVFTSPLVEGQGFENLIEHIAQFQERFPGAYFQSNKLLSQHGQLLSEWTMYNRDGSEFLTAHSFARFNEQGLLTHLAGFWKI